MTGSALRYFQGLPHGQPFGTRVKVKGGDTYKAWIERDPHGGVDLVIGDDMDPRYAHVKDRISLSTLIKGDYVRQYYDTHVLPLWTNVRQVLLSGSRQPLTGGIERDAMMIRFDVRPVAQFKGPLPGSAYRNEIGGKPSQAHVEATAAQITKVLGKPTAGRGAKAQWELDFYRGMNPGQGGVAIIRAYPADFETKAGSKWMIVANREELAERLADAIIAGKPVGSPEAARRREKQERAAHGSSGISAARKPRKKTVKKNATKSRTRLNVTMVDAALRKAVKGTPLTVVKKFMQQSSNPETWWFITDEAVRSPKTGRTVLSAIRNLNVYLMVDPYPSDRGSRVTFHGVASMAIEVIPPDMVEQVAPTQAAIDTFARKGVKAFTAFLGADDLRDPAVSGTACAMRGPLSPTARDDLPARAFGIPRKRAYPMYKLVGGKLLPSASHALAAKGRAATQLEKGTLAVTDYARIITKADKVLSMCDSADRKAAKAKAKAPKRKAAKRKPAKRKAAKRKPAKRKVAKKKTLSEAEQRKLINAAMG